MTDHRLHKLLIALSLGALLLTGLTLSRRPAHAQGDDAALRAILTLGTRHCTLSADPAAALHPPADPPDDAPASLYLTADCQPLLQALDTRGAGTYWFAITLPDDARWLALSAVEGDPHPPQIDGRGRYFSCDRQPTDPQPPCGVQVAIDDAVYRVAITPETQTAATPPAGETLVEETPAVDEPLPDLTAEQQAALDELEQGAAVTRHADGTLTAVVTLSESALNYIVDIYAPLAGYTAAELSLDITPDGFVVTAAHTFLNGEPGVLVYHMVAQVDDQTAVLHTDWATFEGQAIPVSVMQAYDPLINAFVLTQVDATLNKSARFTYTISAVRLSDTALDLVATLRFR